jgi:hypothetical protein
MKYSLSIMALIGSASAVSLAKAGDDKAKV